MIIAYHVSGTVEGGRGENDPSDRAGDNFDVWFSVLVYNTTTLDGLVVGSGPGSDPIRGFTQSVT